MAEPDFWALVIEDDPNSALFTRTVLERHAGMRTVLATHAVEALRTLQERRFDIVVSDIEMPGASGLDILPDIHRLAPGVPVLMLTAHANVDHAVRALRGAAAEFLSKPVPVAVLADRASTLARHGREQRAASPRPLSVLAVGAHPDDVEIGVGATLAAHHAAGDSIVILTLSGGSIGGEAGARHAEAEAAAAVVGARLIHLSFPDTKLDPADGVITAIEQVIHEVVPDQVYTHSAHDRHQDHRAVNAAVQIAARSVPNLACFQSPSSTVDFRPDRFVDIGDCLDTKLRMLAAHTTQAHRDYMQEDVVRAAARYWSRFSIARLVEPLETIRSSVAPAAGAGPSDELATGHST